MKSLASVAVVGKSCVPSSSSEPAVAATSHLRTARTDALYDTLVDLAGNPGLVPMSHSCTKKGEVWLGALEYALAPNGSPDINSEWDHRVIERALDDLASQGRVRIRGASGGVFIAPVLTGE